MDKRQSNNRNGACSNYAWDAKSAFRKLTSDVSISIPIAPKVELSKQLTKPNDDAKDAFRNCGHCHKHFNYHAKSDNAYNMSLNPFPKEKK
jgi:hypothetical protein